MEILKTLSAIVKNSFSQSGIENKNELISVFDSWPFVVHNSIDDIEINKSDGIKFLDLSNKSLENLPKKIKHFELFETPKFE